MATSESRNSIAERANETTDKEVVRLCEIADYAEIRKIGEFFQTRPARTSAGMLGILCGEADRSTSVVRGQLLRRISPRSKIGLLKEIIFQQRRKLGKRPNMIKGLTPHQILGKLTSQTNQEKRKFAGRKDQ